MIGIASVAQLVREVTANTYPNTIQFHNFSPKLIRNDNVWQYQVEKINCLFLNIAKTAYHGPVLSLLLTK